MKKNKINKLDISNFLSTLAKFENCRLGNNFAIYCRLCLSM